MEARLIVVGGKASKGDVSLKLPTTIGRSRQADLTVAHPMVSRQHCELYEEDGVLKLRDLGSLNGTFIDGQRISEASLRPDAQFTVGPLTFCAKYEYAGDVNAIPLPHAADEEAPDFLPAEQEPGIEATPPADQVAVIAPTDAELPDFAAWADSEAQLAGLAEGAPLAQPEPAEPELEEEEEPEPTPPPSLPPVEQAPESDQPAAEPGTEEPPLVPPVEETVQVEVAPPAERAEPEPNGQADERPVEVVEPELEDEQQADADELEDFEDEEEEGQGGDRGKKKRWWPFGKRESKQADSEPEEVLDKGPEQSDADKSASESDDDLNEFFKGLG